MRARRSFSMSVSARISVAMIADLSVSSSAQSLQTIRPSSVARSSSTSASSSQASQVTRLLTIVSVNRRRLGLGHPRSPASRFGAGLARVSLFRSVQVWHAVVRQRFGFGHEIGEPRLDLVVHVGRVGDVGLQAARGRQDVLDDDRPADVALADRFW